jgi:hypothetical protein
MNRLERFNRDVTPVHSAYQTMHALYQPEIPAHKPECPSYLRRGEGQKIWDEILSSLPDSALLPTLVVQLEVYIDLYLQWKRTKRIIDREGHFETYEKYMKKEEVYVTLSRPHHLTDHAARLRREMAEQYRVMRSSFVSVHAFVPLAEKIRSVHERTGRESGRGDLIGGRLAAA